MAVTKKSTPFRMLPSRGGLNDLGKSQRTIVDYAKATPFTVQPNPAEIRNLSAPKAKP